MYWGLCAAPLCPIIPDPRFINLTLRRVMAMSSSDLEVFVSVFGDDVKTLIVNPSTTIRHLMSLIRDFPDGFGDHLLLFGGRNLLDFSSSTLDQCGVTDQDKLILSTKGQFHLHIISAPTCLELGPIQPILVESLENVRAVKEKIQGFTNIPIADQDLYYCWNLMDDDDSTLASYGIYNRGDEMAVDVQDGFRYALHLGYGPGKEQVPSCFKASLSNYLQNDRTIEVEMKCPKCTVVLSLRVNGSDTIGIVKAKIQKKVNNDGGRTPLAYILEDLYMILFNRQVLEVGVYTLDDYGIKDGDKILICPKAVFRISVVVVRKELPKIEKKLYGVCVLCSDTVGTLKTKIKDLVGISSECEMILEFKGKFLFEDESCILEHGILEFPRTKVYKSYVCHDTPLCIVNAVTYKKSL